MIYINGEIPSLPMKYQNRKYNFLMYCDICWTSRCCASRDYVGCVNLILVTRRVGGGRGYWGGGGAGGDTCDMVCCGE